MEGLRCAFSALILDHPNRRKYECCVSELVIAED